MVNALNKPTFPFLLNEYVVAAVYSLISGRKFVSKRTLGGGKNQMGEKVETLFTLLLLFSVVMRSYCIFYPSFKSMLTKFSFRTLKLSVSKMYV